MRSACVVVALAVLGWGSSVSAELKPEVAAEAGAASGSEGTEADSNEASEAQGPAMSPSTKRGAKPGRRRRPSRGLRRDKRPKEPEPESVAPSEPQGPRPVTGRRAQRAHELRVDRGWVAVENEIDLRDVDRQVLALRDEIEKGEPDSGPVKAADGSQQFVFGAVVPKVFCRPGTVCDIALQEGERVVRFASGTGDPGPWIVHVVIANPADPGVRTRRPHIMVRPKNTRVKTTLTVWTDRRTYLLDLVPSDKPMRMISFRYPQDEMKAMLAQAGGGPGATAGGKATPGPFSSKPWEWNDGYEVECPHFRWKCRRYRWMRPKVSDDGNVTQLTLPEEALSRDRPVFHVISPTGERVQVNYTVHGRTYVVPLIFDEASLILRYGTRRRQRVEMRIVRRRR